MSKGTLHPCASTRAATRESKGVVQGRTDDIVLCLWCGQADRYSLTQQDIWVTLEPRENPFPLGGYQAWSIRFLCAESNCASLVEAYTTGDATCTREVILGRLFQKGFHTACEQTPPHKTKSPKDQSRICASLPVPLVADGTVDGAPHAASFKILPLVWMDHARSRTFLLPSPQHRSRVVLVGRHLEQPGFHVLVADVFEPWRDYACSTLTRCEGGCFVHETTDGLETVEKAYELQPDLVLLDISLPQMNGIEAAWEIRSKCPKSRILFASENRSLDVVRKALSTGAQGYMVKSDGIELLAAVEAVRHWHFFVSKSLAKYFLAATNFSPNSR